MKLLLDTHIWLWSLLEPNRLGNDMAEALENKENKLFLSPISTWETMILAEKGRIEFDKSPKDWINEALEQSPLKGCYR